MKGPIPNSYFALILEDLKSMAGFRTAIKIANDTDNGLEYLEFINLDKIKVTESEVGSTLEDLSSILHDIAGKWQISIT